MDLQLNHLLYFKRVAELENMTQASKALHVAQPALSKVIRTLEETLQVKLFDRKGKYIVLNKNGKILLKHTHDVLNSIKDAKAEIADVNHIKQNTVTITMRAASKLLPDILLAFKKQYPHIKLIITQHEKDHVKEASDLTIYSTREKVNSDHVLTLLEEEILLAVPTDHRFSKRDDISIDELSSESFVSLNHGKELSHITSYYCQLANFKPNITLDSDDPATIRALISVGLGIAFLPAITWKMDLKSYQIKLLSISNVDCKRYVNISWKEGAYQSRATQLVYDFMVDFFGQLT